MRQFKQRSEPANKSKYSDSEDSDFGIADDSDSGDEDYGKKVLVMEDAGLDKSSEMEFSDESELPPPTKSKSWATETDEDKEAMFAAMLASSGGDAGILVLFYFMADLL